MGITLILGGAVGAMAFGAVMVFVSRRQDTVSLSLGCFLAFVAADLLVPELVGRTASLGAGSFGKYALRGGGTVAYDHNYVAKVGASDPAGVRIDCQSSVVVERSGSQLEARATSAFTPDAVSIEAEIVEDGKSKRIFLTRQEIYRATYAPLISLISERVSSDNAIDLAVGRPVEEFRFVVALTYEQLSNRRARHLRAMVMYEPVLVSLPEEMPEVDHEEHTTRYRTLLSISRLYRKNPERFGIVRIWRDRELDLPMVH